MSNAKFQRVESDDRFDDQDEIDNRVVGGDATASERGLLDAAPLDHEYESTSTLPLLSVDFDEKSFLAKRTTAVAFALLVCGIAVAAVAAKSFVDPYYWGTIGRGSDIVEVDSGGVSPTSLESSAHGQKESTPKPIHIVYSSDDESLAGVEASIRSVKAHASGPVEFHFIGDTPLFNIPEVHFKPLSHVARKYHLDEYMNPEYERGHGLTGLNTNPANFVRFAIDAFLPRQSKAMWIDADTIVNCDVVSLVNNVLNDDTNVIAAVPRDGPLHGLSKEGDRRYAYIRSSFNAGIYVINLDNWRAQGISEKIRQIALSNRKTLIYKNGSQPPMAIAIEENFEHLPPTWNVAMSDVEEVNDQFMEETCLMHWNGPFKPWNTDNRKDYYVELWLRYGEQVDRRERQHDRLRRSVLEIENMAV